MPVLNLKTRALYLSGELLLPGAGGGMTLGLRMVLSSGSEGAVKDLGSVLALDRAAPLAFPRAPVPEE